MADHEHHLTPEEALGRIQHVSRQVGTAAWWHGWMWLAIAILTPVFILGTREGGLARPWHFWVALAFGATALVLTLLAWRRGVVGRPSAAVDHRATWAYAGAMVGITAIVLIWGPPLSWWFIAVALVPSVPCLVAARRILRG